MLSDDKFAEQVVVVTGAAQGIGAATARLFAQQGATLAMLDIEEDKLKALASEFEKSGLPTAYTRVCDVTSESEVAAALAWTVEVVGGIHVLVHAAGTYPFQPLSDFSTEAYQRIMAVNLDAAFFLVRSVAPIMKAKAYGRIVLFSSSTFQDPGVGSTAYVASKAGIIGLARAAALEIVATGDDKSRELAPQVPAPDITVNVVMPGLIKTEMTWDALVRPDGSHPLFDPVMKNQIVKRMGQPEDIAHAISFLASPEASFITGQVLDVSGGATFH
jgi:NAD(P)-dependent dehydrogenase (short-subunit alcohol dehydrogenase family)